MGSPPGLRGRRLPRGGTGLVGRRADREEAGGPRWARPARPPPPGLALRGGVGHEGQADRPVGWVGPASPGLGGQAQLREEVGSVSFFAKNVTGRD